MANNMTEELTGHKDYTDARKKVYGTDGKIQSGYHHGIKEGKDKDTHAKNMETRRNVNAVKKAGDAVRESKFDKLNHMTIDQLAAARTVLQKKMAEQKITKNNKRVLFEKFTALDNEYVRTQQKIDKYYLTLSNNPLTRTLIQGKRHMLTIAYIKGGKLKPKGKKEGYGMLDEIKRYRPLESMAVAGLVTAGLAGIGFIPGVDFAAFKDMLIKFFFKNEKNPIAAKVLFAGLAVAAGAMAAKGAFSAVKRYKRNKASVNNMNYEMDKASLDEKEKAEEAQRKKEEEERKIFMANMDDPEKLYKAYKNDPAMVKRLTYWVKHPNSREFQSLTSSQKLAVAKAVQKWLLDEKEAKKEIGEANKDDKTKETEAKVAEEKKVLEEFKPVLRGDSAEAITNYMKEHAEQMKDLLDMLKKEVKGNPINSVAKEALDNYNQAKTSEDEKSRDATMNEFEGLLLGNSADDIIEFIRKNPKYHDDLVKRLEKEADRDINNVAKEAYAKFKGIVNDKVSTKPKDIQAEYNRAVATGKPGEFYNYYLKVVRSNGDRDSVLNFLKDLKKGGDSFARDVLDLVDGAKKGEKGEFAKQHPVLVSKFQKLISQDGADLEDIRNQIMENKTLSLKEKSELLMDISAAVIAKNNKLNEKIAKLDQRVVDLEAKVNEQ